MKINSNIYSKATIHWLFVLADLSPFFMRYSNNSTRGASRANRIAGSGKKICSAEECLVCFALISIFSCVCSISWQCSIWIVHNVYTRNVWLVHNLIVILSRKIALLMHHLKTSTPQFCRPYTFTSQQKLMIGVALFAQTTQITAHTSKTREKQFLCGHVSAFCVPNTVVDHCHGKWLDPVRTEYGMCALALANRQAIIVNKSI